MQKLFTYVHASLAAFFLPLGLLYAITGGLYVLDIKGKYVTTDYQVETEQPLPTELSGLLAVAEDELRSRNLDFPTGSARIRKGGTSQYLEWTGTRRDIELHPTTDPNQAVLKVKDTTLHRYFVQLHKAKGGAWFNAFAPVWAVGLIGLLVTGVVLTFYATRYLRTALVASVLGLVAFVLFAWVS